jgi:phage terminase small subunit
MLTVRQKMFADEYLVSGNAEQAAILAGYSEKYARGNAHKLVANSGIKEYIDEKLKEIESSKIADAAEVMRYLTSVMRNETKEEVPVVVNQGDWSEVQIVKKDTSIKDRNKAAEMLAKRFGILTDKVTLEIAPVVIKDDVNESD